MKIKRTKNIIKEEKKIRNQFRRKAIVKLEFIYFSKLSKIKIKVRYQKSPELEYITEYIREKADGLDFELKNITWHKTTKNYEYSIFHLKKKEVKNIIVIK